jgi:hypothetical protein
MARRILAVAIAQAQELVDTLQAKGVTLAFFNHYLGATP